MHFYSKETTNNKKEYNTKTKPLNGREKSQKRLINTNVR